MEIAKIIDAKKYMFLETVPGGYPADVVYFNQGHMRYGAREEFDVDPGKMVLVFKNGNYDIYLEKEKFFKTGRTILDYVLESDKRVKDWEERMNEWLGKIHKIKERYRDLDFEKLSVTELAREYDNIIDFWLENGMRVAEVCAPNYGTNMIHQELEKVLKEMGFSPNAVIPVLLRSSQDFPLLKYENEFGNLALALHAKGVSSLDGDLDEETRSKIDAILSVYEWLDAGISNPPKSRESVMKDVNDLLNFGDKLPGILEERRDEKLRDRKEREEKLAEVLNMADAWQKRVIKFGVKSSGLGREAVDRLMEVIYYARRIFVVIAQRIGLDEIGTKMLLKEEIKDYLLDGKKVSMDEIERRRKLCACFVDSDNVEIYSGDEAREIDEELNGLKSGDGGELKGEVAYSGGKIIGVARIVENVKDVGKIKDGEILVSSRTYPDLVPAMKKAGAIIAEMGGLLSHAAIVSREMKTPCLVGVRGAVRRIKDGDEIEVDTDKGVVRVLEAKE